MSFQNEGESGTLAGNIIAKVANVTPSTVMPVADLFEISMPASTDVRIRAIVARTAYITSEGQYPGGSFTTSTSAPVNVPTTPIPADNNVHVAGEKNVVCIQDLPSGRIFIVTVWRLGPIAGNWSGWVEEIGVSLNFPAANYASNVSAIADPLLLPGAMYTVLVGGFRQVFVK
jgi:hypothetical protein